ncbi:MAG TPA: serine/threonine-protein kinase [Polyangiaceae bacterium]
MVDETTFSIVYRATHVVWERQVAIKVFHVGMGATPEARAGLLAAFVREGALLGELSETCSAICQARDIGAITTADGKRVPYMVLEWLEGESLEAIISRERKAGGRARSMPEVLDLLGPIAQALSCAHARGVSHCDIKPGNIIVLGSEDARAPSRCKLLDFGAARVEGQAAPRIGRDGGRRPFTPAFGAPEQFDEAYGAAGPWTDVFALALTVVELLSGREALPGQDVWTLASQACDQAKRPTPRAFGVTVSNAVEEVLARALAVHPVFRFADAGSFWSALVQAASTTAAEATVEVQAMDIVARSVRREAVTGLEGAVRARRPSRRPPPRASQVRARSGRSVSPFPLVVALAVAAALAFGTDRLPSSHGAHSLLSRAVAVAFARN